MRKQTNPAFVGAFVLGGVALAVVVALVVGSGAIFRETYTLISFFEGDVTGLDAGSPVRYRGVPVGEVTEVRISLENDPRPVTDTRVPVIYELDLTRLDGLVRTGGLSMDNPQAIDSVIAMGLRAELQAANLVTGQRAIELETFTDVPDNRLDPRTLPVPEIPVVANTMSQLQERALAAVDNVASIDFQALAQRLDGVLTGIDEVVGSGDIERVLTRLDGTLASISAAVGEFETLSVDLRATGDRVAESVEGTVENSSRTLATLDTTLVSLREALNPEAPLIYRIDQTLLELENAARSIRHLAEYLEQNPSALLRGRGGSEED